MIIIQQIILVVLPCRENRIEIDAVDAQRLEIVHILSNAIQRSAQLPMDGLVTVGLLGRLFRNPALSGGKAIREDIIDHCILHPIRHGSNIRPVIKGKLKILGAVIHQMIGKHIPIIEQCLFSVIQEKIIVHAMIGALYRHLPIVVVRIAQYPLHGNR